MLQQHLPGTCLGALRAGPQALLRLRRRLGGCRCQTSPQAPYKRYLKAAARRMRLSAEEQKSPAKHRRCHQSQVRHRPRHQSWSWQADSSSRRQAAAQPALLTRSGVHPGLQLSLTAATACTMIRPQPLSSGCLNRPQHRPHRYACCCLHAPELCHPASLCSTLHIRCLCKSGRLPGT